MELKNNWKKIQHEWSKTGSVVKVLFSETSDEKFLNGFILEPKLQYQSQSSSAHGWKLISNLVLEKKPYLRRKIKRIN